MSAPEEYDQCTCKLFLPASPGLTAPGTPPKQSAVAPYRNRPVQAKKPWVVADWKHRVPETPLSKPCKAAVQQLHTEQRAAAVAERKRQLSTEFAVAHETIDRILARCKHAQASLQVRHPPPDSRSSTGSGRAAGPATNQSPHNKLHLTMRSQLLFETPQQTSSSTINNSSYDGCNSHSYWCNPGALDSTDRCIGQPQQQPHACQGAGWCGAVDLNPGFSFRPGTPERAAGVLRHTGPQSVLGAHTYTTTDAATAPSSAAIVPECCKLTHRENLQAGIQQLTGAFYSSMRQQQWQRHQVQQQQLGSQAEVIPATWFGLP